MAEPTYVNVTETEFFAKMTEMGFTGVKLEGTTEKVYERPVVLRGVFTGYRIRVYSSVAHGHTRDVGEDAIRVQLINSVTGYPVKLHGEKRGHKVGKRINRTAPTNLTESERVDTLLGRVRDRCADFWAHVRDNRCPKCTDVMAHRKGKYGAFKSCTNRECDHTESM